MPRPMKWRKVCSLPESSRFGPLDLNTDDGSRVTMTVDEYEAIRLIDLEGFTQEECAKQMNVARTTVQGIYAEARKKLAHALVNGKVLFIEGGEYRLCEGLETDVEEDVAEAGMEGVLQETGRKHGWRIILSMDALSMFLELSAVYRGGRCYLRHLHFNISVDRAIKVGE